MILGPRSHTINDKHDKLTESLALCAHPFVKMCIFSGFFMIGCSPSSVLGEVCPDTLTGCGNEDKLLSCQCILDMFAEGKLGNIYYHTTSGGKVSGKPFV